MQSLRYPRGSEWRRWDLHVHTPYSLLNNGFGDDFNTYAKALFEKAVEKEIAVIGVTDYFLIDGYKQLKILQQDGARLDKLIGNEIAAKARQILLLPNIELRLSVLVNDNRVNFHVLFSDAVDAETIDEHFLRELKFTSASSAGEPDESWSLTRVNLENLGRNLKNHHENFGNESDISVGMKTAVIAHEKVTEVLEDQASRFKDKYLIVVPADEDLSECSWNGEGHLARKLIIQKSHMLFSSNAGTRKFGLGLKHPTAKDFVNEFRGLKPCIHGSDAHSYQTLFEPDYRRYLWIKADPTFCGLQQLLHVPDKRVFIGETPPSFAREKENATKFLDSVRFERTREAKDGENWFSGEVPLNRGLVAIIGNKGSGKSALADILAFLGGTSNSEFPFLNDKKFLAPKTKLGSMFRGKATWHSGMEVDHVLSDPIGPDAPELLKYIPQNYLERICSDLKEMNDDSPFYRELMEVIFSHVTKANQLGKETLPELIQYITGEKEEQTGQLVVELQNVNAELVAREGQLAPEYRRTLSAQLDQRRVELKAYDDAKPPQVVEPSENAENQATLASAKEKLANLVGLWTALDVEIASAETGLRDTAQVVAAAGRLVDRIDVLERHLIKFYEESSADGTVLGLDARKLVTLTVDRKPISDAKDNAERQSQVLRRSVDATVDGSLVQKRERIKQGTEEARAKLDEPNRLYQEYLHQLLEWQKRRDVIEGSPSAPESVKGLESKLAVLECLPAEIETLKGKRAKLVQDIFNKKQELLMEYRKFYSPVQEFITSHPVSQQQRALEFTAAIAVDGLADGLLNMVHQGRRGSFQGEAEGRAVLNDILANSDFSTQSGVEAYLASIQEHFEQDKRGSGSGAVRMSDQLVRGKTPADVYDFVYSLSYLKPRFELLWQGKPLDKLSQGERGTLLLIFYLLIDKRDSPLIIDQPEENLDNQTIVSLLVPAIQHAKERRQVILVTHNPNLAVVCDADQIIYAHLEKGEGSRVTYTCGSIEEPAITQLIVDVLEGTKPAFDMRDARYETLEHSP